MNPKKKDIDYYDQAMKLVDDLMSIDPEADSPEGLLLKNLAIGVDLYERAKGYCLTPKNIPESDKK